ncbi:acyl carrier protein [Hyphomonas sp.]|uniref:acyl carrier protein n=1 Tax=Hyphomonas sp. TaxID=87 RepID=UPI00391C06F4
MTEDQAFEQITAIVQRMLEDKGAKVATIDKNTELLGGAINIDSLDLAMLVRELEDVVGFDPFAEGFIEFRTVGELAKLYAK